MNVNPLSVWMGDFFVFIFVICQIIKIVRKLPNGIQKNPSLCYNINCISIEKKEGAR